MSMLRLALLGLRGRRSAFAGAAVALFLAAVLVTGTVLGLLMGLLIHYFDIQPFIATLAGLFLARGLTYLISVESISISDETFTQLAFKTIYIGEYYIRWTAIIALATVAVAAYVLARTRFGRTVYAIGGSESSAEWYWFIHGTSSAATPP